MKQYLFIIGILLLADVHHSPGQTIEQKRLAFEKAEVDYFDALRLEIAMLKSRMDSFEALIARVEKPETRLDRSLQSPRELNLFEEEPEWESRAIIGFHQAGASSAASTQNAFFDFSIIRGLGNHKSLADSRFNIWGNVRVASSPRQISVPVSQFAVGFANSLGQTPVNEMAQSVEFLTGLGLRLAKFQQGGGRIRTLEAVAFFGGNGSFTDPFSRGAIFKVPAPNTASRAEFDRRHKVATPFIGLVPADRERFYRSYGGGFRLTTFEAGKRLSPPASYMVTVGQDQMITGGAYQGPVLRLDVFYPLPIGKANGRWKSVFLFGTVNMKLARTSYQTPLAMERYCADAKPTDFGCNVTVKNYFDSDVTVVGLASTRDNYRMGVGIDLVNLMRSWFVPPERTN